MTGPVASPAFSLKGWLFTKWIVKNKAVIKGLLVVFFAWLTSVSTAVDSVELRAFLVALVGFASKFLLDLLDYWVTPQPDIEAPIGALNKGNPPQV